MDLIELLKSMVQGFVQGVTEWLPVSSTAHILFLNALWPMDITDKFFDVFKVVIQLGSIFAVILLYFNTLNPFAPKKTADEKIDTWKLWLKIVIASIPAGLVGLLLDGIIDVFEQQFVGRLVMAGALIVYGIAFIWMETRKQPSHASKSETLNDISYSRAFGIGVFQMLALIPGTSRSGSTILGATLLGTSRKVAAEFSFFMAIPMMLGASGLKMFKYFFLEHYAFSTQEWLLLAVATATSFLVSLLIIQGLMSFIRKHSFAAFGWYRIVVGGALIAALLWAPQIFS